MEIFGKVIVIIALVGLAVFLCYQIFAFVRDIVRRVKSKKSKPKDINSVDNAEKGE